MSTEPFFKRVGMGTRLVEPRVLETYVLDALAALRVDDTNQARSVLMELKDKLDTVLYP